LLVESAPMPDRGLSLFMVNDRHPTPDNGLLSIPMSLMRLPCTCIVTRFSHHGYISTSKAHRSQKEVDVAEKLVSWDERLSDIPAHDHTYT
jgi:hypothetical protein